MSAVQFGTVETQAILASVIVTFAIFGLFLAGRKFANLTDTKVYIVGITIGFVVYCIVSGRLTEFSAGGISGKLSTAINAPLNISSVSLKALQSDMPELETVAKTGDPRELRGKLTETHPIVLSLKIGPNAGNVLTNVRAYLAVLGQFRSFSFVLFVDQKNALKAYIPAPALTRLLQKNQVDQANEADAERFIQLLNQGDIEQITAFPSVITKTIRSDATNLTALETMERDNLEAIVVIDPSNDHAVGVVEREQLIAKLLLAVAKSASSP